nr:uncharacterized protein LOC129270438 [Lytechinus pictus]
MGFYDDPFSLFIFASIAMHFFVYNGWHDFLIPQVLQRGISERNTIILTFVAGVGNISIRLAVAILMHKCFEPVNIFLILTFINTISLTFDALFSNYHVMLVTSFCSMACIAGRTILKTVIIRNRFSSENLPMALGVNNVGESVTYFLGGYLSGLVADTYSSYDATILLLAVVDILTFVFMLFPKIMKKPGVNQSKGYTFKDATRIITEAISRLLRDSQDPRL